MKQNTALWYLFDFTTREVNSTNVVLKNLLLEAFSKGLGEEETHFNYFDGSYFRGFSNARH